MVIDIYRRPRTVFTPIDLLFLNPAINDRKSELTMDPWFLGGAVGLAHVKLAKQLYYMNQYKKGLWAVQSSLK